MKSGRKATDEFLLIDSKIAKRCSKCLELKVLTEFYFHRTGYLNCTSACKQCMNEQSRLGKHGIEISQLQSMYEKQQNRCAICGSDTELEIDHCHESNEIRELLCMQCNTGLGNFKDNPDILQKAANYLFKHKKVRA